MSRTDHSAMMQSRWPTRWLGHLGDEALVDVCLDESAHPHLLRCDHCRERLAEVRAMLDQARTEAVSIADEVFTPDRLVAQRAQILRRIDRASHPARIIAFPMFRPAGPGRRLVARRWVAVAAAAGLMLGVVAGTLVDFGRAGGESARLDPRGATARVGDARADFSRGAGLQPVSFNEEAFLGELESAVSAPRVEELQAIDALTPTVREAQAFLVR